MMSSGTDVFFLIAVATASDFAVAQHRDFLVTGIKLDDGPTAWYAWPRLTVSRWPLPGRGGVGAATILLKAPEIGIP